MKKSCLLFWQRVYFKLLRIIYYLLYILACLPAGREGLLKRSIFVPVVIFLSVLAVSGCDKIAEFKKEYFSPRPKQAAPQATPAPQAVETSATAPNVLAKAGNWTITIEEFNERLARLKEAIPEYDINNPEAKKMVLEELVNQQLFVLDAEERGVAQQKEIAEALAELRRTLLVREVAGKLVAEVKATEQEAQDYYNQEKERLAEPVEWHVREIVANTEVGANEILAEILKGADFAQLAKDRSVSKSAAGGGDLGFLKPLSLLGGRYNGEPGFVSFSQMETILQTLEPGKVSAVFKGPEGFYIVKLEEKRGGQTKDFAEIKDEIITGLTLLKQQKAITDHLENLKQKTPIVINENLLQEQK